MYGALLPNTASIIHFFIKYLKISKMYDDMRRHFYAYHTFF